MPPDPEQLIGLLQTEKDIFRLTIRGHALIDDKLDDLLADAFVDGKIPGFLKGPAFRRKLELALALGLIPPNFKAPIEALTKLRDELAHGRITDVGKTRAQSIFATFGLLAPQVDDGPLASAWGYVMLTIAQLWAGLSFYEEVARTNRERAQDALAAAATQPLAQLYLNALKQVNR